MALSMSWTPPGATGRAASSECSHTVLVLAHFVSRMEYDFDAIEEEDSPYPEVRASVSNVDDPEMPARELTLMVSLL